MKRTSDIVSRYFPETGAGGYTSIDGTVEFFGRVNSLLDEEMSILDFGAGRAAWFEDDTCRYRKKLRTIKGKVKRVVGCDIDDAILQNKSVDERFLIKIGEGLPFESEKFDLIVADYVFEHITNANEVCGELRRVLKPGGWLCARTPNRYSYVSIMTRLIRNRHHAEVLKKVQPERKSIDVFPTAFNFNSMRDVMEKFGKENFDNFSYRYNPEPAYFFNSSAVFAAMYFLNKALPPVMKSSLFVFLRKKEIAATA